jgi:amino acid adenylation domain-containing protein
MKGELNLPALEQTFTEVTRRHEVLRTIFPNVDGKAVPRVEAFGPLRVPVIDLSQLDKDVREEEVHRITRDSAARPFDLTRGPLVRCGVVRVAGDEHLIGTVMHHINYDGWSRHIFVKEIATAYQAFTDGGPSPLPEPALQYRDFAAWQRQVLQETTLEEDLRYWKQKLSGSHPLLQLPADRPHPSVPGYHGGRVPFQLSKAVSQQLSALSRKHGATLFMTLLAAFKTLLYRYTGREDIIVGTSVAGRTRPEIENLIGFFVNMVVLRTQWSGEISFTELLARVRDVTLEAFNRQDVPFEMLVDQLQSERNLSYSPIFQVVFSMQNAPASELKLAGLSLTFPQVDEISPKYDLLMDVWESEHGLSGALEYNAEIFDPSTAAQIAVQYQTLLGSVAASPEQRLSAAAIADEAEQARRVVDWNRTEREYPSHRCIHHLFEEQAQKTPGATAVVFEDESLTYDELNRRANQLARFLQLLGAGPGKLIGLCIEHCTDEVVALLAALKSGSGYVPLVPQYPQHRISFMLTDEVRIVLTTQELSDRIDFGRAKVICLDSDRLAITQEAEENVQSGVIPEDLAYVIYTSGSTGEPKGVAIAHRSLVSYIWWAKDVYLQGRDAGFALYSSLGFDLTVTSIYTALITGNPLIVFRQQGKEPPLEAILRDGRVGVLKLTPSHLALIKDADNRGSSVRCLIVGGEALATRLAREVHESFGRQAEIYNEYGPTEATVGCMIHRFDPDEERAVVPIGVPAANTQVYVLDRWLNPVAGTMAGEMYLSGDCLARGYLNSPRLTEERFVPNSFLPGRKMYKTGDLARWLPAGVLEYLGRTDDQVKLRGFRIELAEIEALLSRHPMLQDAAVMLREDVPGDKRLVAYIVASGATAPETNELRRYLLEKLPEFMVPFAFVELKALPTTANGKVDRRALPAPEMQRPTLEAEYVEAQTMTEQSVAAIWQHVLRLERAGIYDDFFQLGGQSILAIQIIQRINQAFEIDLPMRTIFADPTIAGLAVLIEETVLKKLESLPEPQIEAGSRV